MRERGGASLSARAWFALPHPVRLPLAWLLIIGSYLGTARVCLSVTVAHQTAPTIWAPAGIALAAVVLGGRRMLPGVAIGSLVAELTVPQPLLGVVVIVLGSSLQAAVGALLLRRFRVEPSLERIRDVAGFLVLAAGISTLISATIGVTALTLLGHTPASAAPGTWRAWWFGDMAGEMLGAPAILVLAHGPVPRLAATARAVAALVLVTALAAATVTLTPSNSPIVYVAVPIVLLLAVVFRQRGAIAAGLIVSAVAVWFISRGQGPFLGGSPATELVRVQMFVSVATLTALLTAAGRSERDVAESALRRLSESERALAEAQRLASIGSFEWSRRTGRVSLSDELYRIYGLDPESQAGYEWWSQLIHDEDRARMDEIVARSYHDRSSYTAIYRVVRPDGHVRICETRGRVETDEHGEPVRLLGTVQDITAFKLAEDRFRTLLETAPDAMVIVDEAGDIVLVNSQTERMFGYTREELVGSPATRLVPGQLGPGAAALTSTATARLADTAAPAPMGSALDLFAMRKDGSEFPVEISLSPLQTDEGALVSAAIRDVTERKLAADALTHQASHDHLTGLPNRTLFLDRLEHALARARRSRSKLAVLFLDLDDFKLINDTLGHDAGDQLLVSITPRLTSALRPGDTVARFGGDEFVVLCEDLASEETAVDIAGRIAAACGRPLTIEGHEHVVTTSAGAVIVEAGAATPAEVLRDADAAMYRAKARGKGRVEVFDDRMRARLVERMGLESDLREALDDDQFCLYFQPIVALARDEIVGFEALVRWRHTERGLLDPAEFIHVAESSGLVVPLGEWVIENACVQAVRWGIERPEKPLSVSVNVSARQFARSDVATTVRRTLSMTGLDPALLSLEITEKTLLDDADASMRALRDVRALGVRIVLDDFGTGYSSLSNLRRFTIDALKIDRSFVDGLERQDGEGGEGEIVNAVLSMAHALGVHVTAEGVETAAQVTRLRERGCEYAQGYLFSRPVPEEELGEMLIPRASSAEQLWRLLGRMTGAR